MRHALIAFTLVAFAPAAALSADPASNDPKPPKEKKICKTEEAESTSRIRKRVCRTVKEWDEANESRTDASDLKRLGAH